MKQREIVMTRRRSLRLVSYSNWECEEKLEEFNWTGHEAGPVEVSEGAWGGWMSYQMLEMFPFQIVQKCFNRLIVLMSAVPTLNPNALF